MNSEENNQQEAVVATLPRGANGIPEPSDLEDRDLDLEPDVKRPTPGPRIVRRLPWSRAHYAEWIAASAVIGGGVAAIVGCTRELVARSRRRAWSVQYRPMHGTKPHGDKLLPHGQRHW